MADYFKDVRPDSPTNGYLLDAPAPNGKLPTFRFGGVTVTVMARVPETINRMKKLVDMMNSGASDVAPNFYPVWSGVWRLNCMLLSVVRGRGAKPFASAAPWPRCPVNRAA